MIRRTPQTAAWLAQKGDAKPPPEPRISPSQPADGRRVGTTLPLETYILFKARNARVGVTGGQAILAAIERMLRDD